MGKFGQKTSNLVKKSPFSFGLLDLYENSIPLRTSTFISGNNLGFPPPKAYDGAAK